MFLHERAKTLIAFRHNFFEKNAEPHKNTTLIAAPLRPHLSDDFKARRQSRTGEFSREVTTTVSKNDARLPTGSRPTG